MKAPILCTVDGWTLQRFDTIQSGRVYRWRKGNIEVNAGREGVGIVGILPVSGLWVLRAATHVADACGMGLPPTDGHAVRVTRMVAGETEDKDAPR